MQALLERLEAQLAEAKRTGVLRLAACVYEDPANIQITNGDWKDLCTILKRNPHIHTVDLGNQRHLTVADMPLLPVTVKHLLASFTALDLVIGTLVQILLYPYIDEETGRCIEPTHTYYKVNDTHITLPSNCTVLPSRNVIEEEFDRYYEEEDKAAEQAAEHNSSASNCSD